MDLVFGEGYRKYSWKWVCSSSLFFLKSSIKDENVNNYKEKILSFKKRCLNMGYSVTLQIENDLSFGRWGSDL